MCWYLQQIQILLFLLLMNGNGSGSSGDLLMRYAKSKNTIRLLEVTEVAEETPYDRVHYTTANLSFDFKSSVQFHPRGMAHLYMLTEKFIKLIGKDQAFPEGFLEITEENTIHVADVEKDWPVLLQHYSGVVTVIICITLFATLMPIIGLTFCCCRCVGRCGARSQPFDKRYDPCRRNFYGGLLIVITVLISYGVICSFATNEVLEDGVKNLPKNIRDSLTDTQLYLNNTKQEIQTLLVVNFKEMERTLVSVLRISGKTILDRLSTETNATVLWNLTSVVDGLRLIKNDLNKINDLTFLLHEKASRLDFGLKQIGAKIMYDVRQCQKESACKDFARRYNLNNLALETNFSQLPNITSILQNLNDLMASGIEKELLKGKVEFEKIQKQIQDFIESNSPLIMDDVKRTGNAIENGANHMIGILDKMKAVITEHINHPIDDGEQMISEVSPYRYYVCFTVSCVLFVIFLCLAFGLLCGCCGNRPNSGYQEDCCNKGTGSRYLMLGVWLMFLTSGALMAVALMYFMAGVTTDKVVCQSLKDPHNSRTFILLDKLANVERFYKNRKYLTSADPVRLRDIVRNCHMNRSLYEVLELDTVIDISDVSTYTQKFGIEDRINDLVDKIKLDYDIHIITLKAQNLLIDLAHSKLNEIDFPAYTNVISDRFTTIDLLQLAAAINETASQLSLHYTNITYSLHNSAMYLQTHQKLQVSEMSNIVKQLESTAHQLQEHLKFNHTSLKPAIDQLLLQLESAQTNIKENGRDLIKKLAKQFGRDFTHFIDTYLTKVVWHTRKEIGKCWPVSQAYNATIIAGCNRILSPFNGFWMSVGSAVLLFIPAIIVSVLLANLYQKSDPYPGPLVEAEYFYDVYGGERDNVPLASVHDKKRRKHNRKPHDECCSSTSHNVNNNINTNVSNIHNSASADGARSRHHNNIIAAASSAPLASSAIPLNSSAPTSSSQLLSSENRFDEVASKQRWEFPVNNMNVPNFQSNPAQSHEYERPPPYYYPGPATQGAVSDCEYR